MIVGIDFDGTIVKHEFPKIGDEIPHCKRVIRRLIENGHQIVLWTMRSDRDTHDESGEISEEHYLKEAVDHCIDEINFKPWGVNENPDQNWSDSPKAYCHVYIDDAALGCPLISDMKTFDNPIVRPYVDWLEVERQLAKLNFFTEI